jgi:hypothetical protein
LSLHHLLDGVGSDYGEGQHGARTITNVSDWIYLPAEPARMANRAVVYIMFLRVLANVASMERVVGEAVG